MYNPTQPNHIYLIYIRTKRIWHWITYHGWYAIKPNQIKISLKLSYIAVSVGNTNKNVAICES